MSQLRGLAESRDYKSLNNSQSAELNQENEQRLALIILKELLEEEVIFNQHISDLFSKDKVRSIENLNEIKNLEFKPVKPAATVTYEEVKVP